ncbi:fibroblast growth factor-binding protein 1-like [Heptranchias perlo]|uniref:fibroblast growth factor-binding protein 1-like n=1 Tax=Heptranchias perlo TaxID=212740 RepID=UPI00355A01BD
MKFSRVVLLLLLLFITQYLLADASDNQKQRRKGKGQSRGETQGGSKNRKPETAPKVGAEEKKQREVPGSAPKQGRFVRRDKAQCKWTLRGEEAAARSLRLECKQGLNDYWCEFTGQPSACPNYTGNAKTYWKQITRTLKKQKSVCSEPSAVLKSSLCKSTRAAHLKMTRSSLLGAAAPGKKQPKALAPLTTANPDSPNINKIADENCSEKWGSLCKFMFSAFQG